MVTLSFTIATTLSTGNQQHAVVALSPMPPTPPTPDLHASRSFAPEDLTEERADSTVSLSSTTERVSRGVM
jgi:hypothetical protein